MKRDDSVLLKAGSKAISVPAAQITMRHKGTIADICLLYKKQRALYLIVSWHRWDNFTCFCYWPLKNMMTFYYLYLIRMQSTKSAFLLTY